MKAPEPYNPLDKRHLGENVADALLRGVPGPLKDVPSFQGAGIYALYYAGPFPPYEPITALNRDGVYELPIYVGKAVPPGARKGMFGLDAEPGPALSSRLRQHAAGLDQTLNLDLGDFFCRYLVVEDIWIPLGENLLVAKFAPIWNTLIDGFGNHDPGKGRYNQVRSRWDVLHPGRSWVGRLQDRPETADQIITELKAFLRDQLR